MAKFNEITPVQLMRLIGTPDAPVVVDVCIDADFQDDPRVVPTAMRIPHLTIGDHAKTLQGKHVVVICQKGKKLSHGAAAILRANEIRAEVLTGGNFAWRDAGLPLVPTAHIPNFQNSPSRWVTRHRPKVDRIACPWLIRRFIHPQAQFMFVPPADVSEVAEKFDATPFDIDGIFWSHDGENCTFDTMIKHFCLTTPALSALSDVVRAADTNTHHLSPQAAGLLAISVGLSHQYSDDTAQLEAGMVVYDAMYRWARDGQAEGHDWPDSGQKP
ncbi:MAG: chromate resistance protein ChrB domain-containing protein [Planktomarina sp.]